MNKPLKVGTRESKLARLQTSIVVEKLHAWAPELCLEVVPITTGGDKVLDKPISELGSKGVFVKELEEALLAGRVDLVVHSLKDLPTELPDGLILGAVLDRADPRDVLVSRDRLKFEELPAGSRIATSSRRRTAQLRYLRKDLDFIDVRGNITTRLSKLQDGHCDAMILAAAGLIRLDATDNIGQYFSSEVITPAAGQGALAVECRSDDAEVVELLRAINDTDIKSEVTCERAFLHVLGGGCSVPIGALATVNDVGQLHLTGCVAALDGSQLFRSEVLGSKVSAEEIAKFLAEQMLASGAAAVLAALKESAPQAISPP